MKGIAPNFLRDQIEAVFKPFRLQRALLQHTCGTCNDTIYPMQIHRILSQHAGDLNFCVPEICQNRSPFQVARI